MQNLYFSLFFRTSDVSWPGTQTVTMPACHSQSAKAATLMIYARE